MTRSLLYILIYATCNVSGAALIKWQLKGKSLTNIHEWLKLMLNLPFILAFLLIVLSALAFFKALSTNSFSMIVPIATGINFMLTIGVGYYLFQDRFTMLSFIGFILIISGIIVLSINNQSHA
jgi:multidrug transporter EmrE-like cation transporter